MKKIIITYGLISGVIVSTMLYISMPLMQKGIFSYTGSMIVGYTSMVIAFSLIFANRFLPGTCNVVTVLFCCAVTAIAVVKNNADAKHLITIVTL